MTTDKVIKEIKKDNKFYIGKMPHSTAFSILNRYKNGTLKFKTLERFLNKFGYKLKSIEWEKNG